MSEARELALRLGGRWLGRYGTAPCPVCQHSCRADQNALTLTDGNRGLLLDCKKSGCRFTQILQVSGFRRARPKQHLSTPVSSRNHGDTTTSQHARKLWDASGPITGSPAEIYLREVRMVEPPATAALRFNSRTWHGPSGRNLPAMIALIEGASGFAVSRTFLKPDGLGKASLPKHQQKLMLGRAAGGHVALTAGIDTLVVAEGIETALSLPQLLKCSSATIWAALSAANMRSVILPLVPGHLAVAIDGDEAGLFAGEALAARAVGAGWTAELRSPPDGRDWNDTLIEQRVREAVLNRNHPLRGVTHGL